jgi:hypothetical protein
MDGSPLLFILMLIVPTPLLVGWLVASTPASHHQGEQDRS